jgi:hypothetical protein
VREKRNAYRILMGTLELKGPLRKPRHMREENIKTAVREI